MKLDLCSYLLLSIASLSTTVLAGPCAVSHESCTIGEPDRCGCGTGKIYTCRHINGKFGSLLKIQTGFQAVVRVAVKLGKLLTVFRNSLAEMGLCEELPQEAGEAAVY
ncbi:hypothetical protein CC80DRAFT_489855 [Byssothecium circinans]|uniref:Hydrophobin n=1 Tax=Byssothecium circinans TaxID=147558 RepID=A0A6A5UFA0_9PLEO|nr:hypothetical protein CC80DRAFT_489855 [Byssothecium circinans]